MGKKHKHPEHENLERWLVSYADFITLLFATFVVLYALGQLDLAKFKELKSSLAAAFSGSTRGLMDKTNGMLDGQKDAGIMKNSGNSIMDKMDHSKTGSKQGDGQGSLDPVKDMVKKVNAEINKNNDKAAGKEKQKEKNKGKGKDKDKGAGKDKADEAKRIPNAQLLLEERGIVIRMASSTFFNPGQATLKPEALKALDIISDSLIGANRVIQVEGHTDSDPISSGQFPSNWELSTSRAASVVRYLINKHNFPKSKLIAAGYAESRPVAPNNSIEGKAKNRRVDIVILFSKSEPGKNESPQSLKQDTKQSTASTKSPKQEASKHSETEHKADHISKESHTIKPTTEKKTTKSHSEHQPVEKKQTVTEHHKRDPHSAQKKEPVASHKHPVEEKKANPSKEYRIDFSSKKSSESAEKNAEH